MDVIGGCWLVVVERGAGGRRTRGTDTALKTTFNNPTRQCGEQSLYRLTLVILSLDSNIRTSKACRSEYEPHQQEGYTISIYIYMCVLNTCNFIINPLQLGQLAPLPVGN